MNIFNLEGHIKKSGLLNNIHRRSAAMAGMDKLKERTDKKLKADVYRAQRLYYLCLKYEDRVPECIREFSKNILNVYTCRAKEADLKLSKGELLDRLLE